MAVVMQGNCDDCGEKTFYGMSSYNDFTPLILCSRCRKIRELKKETAPLLVH